MTAHPYQTEFYPETAFGGFSDIDGTVAFYSRINALVEPSSRVIDFGCGRGAHAEDPVLFRRRLTILKGRVARVIGVDIDAAGETNETLDEFRLLLPDAPWPVADHTADVVIADCVVEHLPNPPGFFQEAHRALTPAGYLCIRTTNLLSYVGMASKLVPNKHHATVLSRARLGRKEEDGFPTLYRCNTVFQLKQQMARVGFRSVVYGYEAEPAYLQFSKLAYALGVLHQKFAPRKLRPVIFAFGQLPTQIRR